MLALIALTVFASVASVTFALLTPSRDPVRRRILDELPDRDARAAERQPRLASRLGRPALYRAGSALARLLPQNLIAGIDAKLAMANDPWSLPGFLFAWALSVLAGAGLVIYLVLSAGGLSSLQLTVMAFTIISFAALVPYTLLRRKARSRQRATVRALPDAIDLLYTSVEAGLGVDAAFALVVERTEGPLSDAFALYLRQVGLGRDRRSALAEVARRTGVQDFVGVANAINQGEEMGTTLGDVLRVQAEELRRVRRERAQTAAQRAPVLMTIPLVLCFLPAMGAVVIVPSALNLLRFVNDLGS